MSKLSFRARALDASKPLPVFRCEDLPDLHEYASINRAVPQMPTGMEKEEESEHHLQRAISAQQVYGEKRDNMVIPVPEAERNITHYDSLYPGEFKMPKQLIHIQPFSLDAEQPDYDLDSEDETFVNKLKKKMEITALQFEEMIDRLEKGSGQQLVSLQEAKLLLKEDDELIKEVFDYWSRKRKTCTGGSLIPTCKGEKRDGSSTSDPYVAFRRRTEKMQTRKLRSEFKVNIETDALFVQLKAQGTLRPSGPPARLLFPVLVRKQQLLPGRTVLLPPGARSRTRPASIPPWREFLETSVGCHVAHGLRLGAPTRGMLKDVARHSRIVSAHLEDSKPFRLHRDDTYDLLDLDADQITEVRPFTSAGTGPLVTRHRSLWQRH
ncbi:enhancer of polycomb homolog 1-like [Notothenia coriiceps]|uniref:Enhancer of polycomb homolog n=1 Tax=Notothenia coriiceps TaxID=8208 RepID=A0A6I9PXA3_9TELE|nr:PREDICTED: enhancer of polycomb homolog 1-like [Notothenia coriiceps]